MTDDSWRANLGNIDDRAYLVDEIYAWYLRYWSDRGAVLQYTLPARYRRFGWRRCENATGDFGKRQFFYPRVARWSKSGFQLEKIQVSAQGNQFSAPVTIGYFHTGSVETGQTQPGVQVATI
jgi:hypothetical protein